MVLLHFASCEQRPYWMDDISSPITTSSSLKSNSMTAGSSKIITLSVRKLILLYRLLSGALAGLLTTKHGLPEGRTSIRDSHGTNSLSHIKARHSHSSSKISSFNALNFLHWMLNNAYLKNSEGCSGAQPSTRISHTLPGFHTSMPRERRSRIVIIVRISPRILWNLRRKDGDAWTRFRKVLIFGIDGSIISCISVGRDSNVDIAI